MRDMYLHIIVVCMHRFVFASLTWYSIVVVCNYLAYLQNSIILVSLNHPFFYKLEFSVLFWSFGTSYDDMSNSRELELMKRGICADCS